jgi:hypothetical protein
MGCLGGGIETSTTEALKNALIPTVTLGTPSSVLVNSSSTEVSIPVTYKNVTGALLTSASLTATTTSSPTAPSCTVTYSNNADGTGTLRLNACTGDGTIRYAVSANAVKSPTGHKNVLSNSTSAITVDNIGPTVSSYTPATGEVSNIPTTLTVTLNEAIDSTLVTTGFATITGTCATPPTVSAATVSTDKKTVTVTLAGAACVDGETVIVALTNAQMRDTVGNVAAGVYSRTYTAVDSPTVTFGTPVETIIMPSETAQFPMTFTATDVVPTIDSLSITMTTTGATACSTVASSGVTTGGGTAEISGCTGDGTVRIQVNGGVLQNSLGGTNSASAQSATVTVDGTAPTITGSSPAAGPIVIAPSSLAITFSEDMDAADIIMANFTAGGTCATHPTITGVSLDATKRIATVSLNDAGTCANGETFTLSTDESNFHDLAGNAGAANPVVGTYTYDLTGPTVAFAAPSATRVNNAGATVTIAATFTNANVAPTPPVVDNTTIGLTTTGTANCTKSASAVTAAGATIELSACTGDGTVKAHLLADAIHDATNVGNLLTGDSAAITVDNTGPTANLQATIASTAATGITLTFNEEVAPTAGTHLAVSGCAGTEPIIANIMTGDNINFTFDLDDSASTCVSGETLVITYDSSLTTDTAGNAGTNTDTISFLIP